MNIRIKTNKGNEFDVKDSIYLTSVGESDFTNAAFSFYNSELEFGISYFVDKNMIVFQNDNYDEEYWNDDKMKNIEVDLSKHIYYDKANEEDLPFDYSFIVYYILEEMDNYYDWLNEKYKDFADYLKAILSDV